MIKLLKKWWKYTTARLSGSFNENADPKVQLEQAIIEAQDQHRRLKEQAASVIANQKQTEMRLNRTLEDYEKVSANARQAILMAEDAQKAGKTDKFNEFTAAAEAFANKIIAYEREIEDMKSLHFQSTQAAETARAAVSTNSSALQKKLAERQKLLGQLDQAKMQEQMNTAMASLSEAVGEEVPTFDEVREKIEGRYARAKGMSELSEDSVESSMIEIEKASQNFEAQARLAEIRTQLGLGAAEGEVLDEGEGVAAIAQTSSAASTPTDTTTTDEQAQPQPG